MTIDELMQTWPFAKGSHLWTWQHGGVHYELYTNGHFMICRAAPGAKAERFDGNFDKIFDDIVAWDPTHTVTRAQLLAFADVEHMRRPCGECGGTGDMIRECSHCAEDHQCICDECDNGFVTPDRRTGVFGSMRFDLRYVRSVVEVMEGDEFEIGTHGDALLIRGSWTAMILEIKGAPDDATVPSFPPMEPDGPSDNPTP